ncbi:MAG TPA: DJ-1/PfpI family protein [Labilithrix sp.]|nr:DJ-1/PfpI family protein [Labilithrix sp.]
MGHGPWLLVSAELVGGRTLASWPGVRDDIVHAGGIWRDEPAVVDRNWVTSRGPADLDTFIRAMIDSFSKPPRSAGSASLESTPRESKASSPQYDVPISLGRAVRGYLSRPEVWALIGILTVIGIGAFSMRRPRQL